MEEDIFESMFEERNDKRGGFVMGICGVWSHHDWMFGGVDDFFFELFSYFCE